ncbi:MAG: hypothetical protein KGJ80_14905, partial [Chloroflexota bacterium]|nr:hypothetical protein [Chloroflexota bacterium]
AIVREDEMFIAQAGPGLTCVVRGAALTRYPDQSPWFDPNEETIAELMASRNFPTEGTVPMGMRRNYIPDQFHVTLQPGDIAVLSTRTLAHLLSNEELVDTLAHRHPDEIVANLEDLAGAGDLSVIALKFGEESAAPAEPPAELAIPIPSPIRPPAAPALSLDDNLSAIDETPTPAVAAPVDHPAALPQPSLSEAELPAEPAAPPPPSARRPRVQIDRAKIRAAALRFTSTAMGALAAIFSRVDWKSISAGADRAISNVSRAFVRALLFLLRGFLPGAPPEDQPARATPPARQSGWRVAAIAFPILLIAAGGGMWAMTRAEQQRQQAAQLAQLINQAKAAVDTGKNLAPTDKNGARAAFQKALALTDQAKALSPADQSARSVGYDAQDELDKLNGISVLLYLPSFATYSDPKANPSRIVLHYPDVYVLDRGLSRVYHYTINDVGSSATPTPGDGIILRAGDKSGDVTVGDLIDLTLVDQGNRLIAIDKTGAFLEYDPAKNSWATRRARDSAQWSRISLVSNYAGNLYLVDQGRNQILKYIAAEGAWTSSVTYFAPGVNIDLSGVVDIAIDGDVWLLRGDGSVARFTLGKPNDLPFRDLDAPLSKSVSMYTNKDIASVYIADAGNQRIAQIDKTSGKFTRQFKPTGQLRDAFNRLKALAVDEQNKRILFINGNQAYLATIPQ